MSLKQSLRQTIATLDRIAPDPDRESFTSSCHADDEKASLRGDTLLSHPYQASHDDEKFIRLSTSTLEEPYHLQHSRSRSSLHRSRYLPEVDLSEMETPGDDAPEPKITLHYVANLIFEFLAVPLCFINLAIGACIIGLAADNMYACIYPTSTPNRTLTFSSPQRLGQSPRELGHRHHRSGRVCPVRWELVQ